MGDKKQEVNFKWISLAFIIFFLSLATLIGAVVYGNYNPIIATIISIASLAIPVCIGYVIIVLLTKGYTFKELFENKDIKLFMVFRLFSYYLLPAFIINPIILFTQGEGPLLFWVNGILVTVIFIIPGFIISVRYFFTH